MYCDKIKTKGGQWRWECVADGPRDSATGKRNQITRRGKTQKEAKKKVEEEIKRQEESGINYKAVKNTTFEEMAQDWYELYSLTGNKDSTYLRKRKDIRVLNKHIAKQPITKITHYMYQKVINNISKDYAENTVRNIHGSANQIFKYAVKNKWMKENPAADVVIPTKQKTIADIKQEQVQEKFFDRDELEEFLKATVKYGKKHDIERFYTLAFSGMRPGELCALKKSDLHFGENIIDVNKTLYNEKNNMKEYQLTLPKTYKSVREIPIDPSIMNMLKSVVLENDKHKMKFRNKNITYYNKEGIYHDADFVFARKNGYPYTTVSLNVRMNRILKKTNIKKNATPHIFRHTHVSMLTEAGVDLPTIMKIVGHEDSDTTMKIYTHVTKKMRKDAPVKITNLYGNILEKITF